MSNKIKYMNLQEFKDLGFLQECNRTFMHPLGIALEIKVDENDKAISLGGIWDYRDDPEGMVFGDLDKTNKIKAQYVQQELEKHKEARIAKFGSVIQPIK